MGRVPRTTRVLPRASVPITTEIPKSAELYLDLYEDEAKLIDEDPTTEQLEGALRNKWVKWLFVKMRLHSNRIATELLNCEPERMQDLRGRVKGLHDALGFPAMMLNEARAREGPEPQPEVELPSLEPDDFPPEPAGAG